MDKNIENLVLKEAAKSECTKRKVGAIVMSKEGEIIGKGHNYISVGPCENSNGYTYTGVVHAEVAAIDSVKNTEKLQGSTIYITHKPCSKCTDYIVGKYMKYKIIEGFMKHDKDKLRYSLIPTIITKALASVLTYGAKKYKPNNWKNVDDTDRYWDALYRHLEARREGEIIDKESKLPHLWHAITNIGFLLYLDDKTKPKTD